MAKIPMESLTLNIIFCVVDNMVKKNRSHLNTILNIMGLLGVPKLQNMRILTKIQHGNVFVNAI